MVRLEGLGSAVDLVFAKPDLLQAARLSVQALQKSYAEHHIVWLDARKERSELRPARIIHRMYDTLTETETSMDPPLPVEKTHERQIHQGWRDVRRFYIQGQLAMDCLGRAPLL